MDQDDVRAIFDASAATYDSVAFPFFESFGEALVEFAELTQGEHVLDAGCGTGAVLAPAAAATGSAVGVELSPKMAERARAAAPNAVVVVGDAAQLPFDDDTFDAVLASFVVFFTPDPTRTLEEWRRVLKPGGRVVMSTWGTPDRRWEEWERPLRGSYVPQMDPATAQGLGAGLGMLARFDESSKVAAELAGAGFTVEDVREHALEFVFPDEQSWWDWNLSHGSRVFIDALPTEAQMEFREEMREAMEAVRGESGYPRTYTALFSRATA